MNKILSKAQAVQQQARDVINETGVTRIWESKNATINLIGSLQTGLMINNRDIDFHIYSNPFKLEDSFAAISELAQKQGITKISYANLLDTPEQCVEWHAWYQAPDGNTWQIDMIHILETSPYAGYFEKVAARINQVLTPQTKQAILEIKQTASEHGKVRGIEVYKAVIQDGVKNFEQFLEWKKSNPEEEIINWMP